jgi:hypothetical protein
MFFGNAMPSPSLKVRVSPLTSTLTVALLVVLTPRTFTSWKYVPASPAGFTPHSRKWSEM